jgi:hypothetical protein
MIRVILLLFADVLFLIFGLILLNHKWNEWKWLKQWGKSERVENILNGTFLALTVFLVFLPIPLAVKVPAPQLPAQPVPVTKKYLVAIPYSDDSIARQLGLSKWSGRLLCEVTPCEAVSRSEAIAQAEQAFADKGRQVPMFSQAKGSKVDMLPDKIVVEERQ